MTPTKKPARCLTTERAKFPTTQVRILMSEHIATCRQVQLSQYEAAVNGKSDPLAYVDALVAHHHETVFGKGGQA